MNIFYHGDRTQISSMLFTLFDSLTRPSPETKTAAQPEPGQGDKPGCRLDYAVLDIGQWGLEKEDLCKIAGFLLRLAEGREDEDLLRGDSPVAVLSTLIRQCYHCKDFGVQVPEHDHNAGRDEYRQCSGYAMEPARLIPDVEYIRPMQSRIKAC